jgi:hypothetical protein
MRDGGQSRQPEEAAGPLDRVNQAKDVAQKAFVIRILLELNEFDVQLCQAFVAFSEKLTEQIVHFRILRHSHGQVRAHEAGAHPQKRGPPWENSKDSISEID